MLKSLRIDKFKTYDTLTEIPAAPLTLIYGANSAGKSSIIQSLLLLSQSVKAFNNNPAAKADLAIDSEYLDYRPEKWERLINRQQSEQQLTLGLTFGNQEESHCGLNLKFKKEVLGNEDILRLESIEGELPDHVITPLFTRHPFEPGNPTKRTFGIHLSDAIKERLISKQISAELVDKYAQFLLDAHIQTGDAYIPDTFDTGHVDDQDLELFKDVLDAHESILQELATPWEAFLNTMAYLGPIRKPLEMSTTLTTDKQHPEGEGILNRLFHCPEAIERVNYWMEKLGSRYTIKLRTGSELSLSNDSLHLLLQDSQRKLEVYPHEVGFGIGQMLPILVNGCLPDTSFICVEQPEIHLHPRLQAEMADFFLASSGVLKDSPPSITPKQWFIETHSEVLMLRIRRRIRAGLVDRDKIKVIYVLSPEEQEEFETTSKVLDLRISKRGNFLDDWPSGFFEERYKENFAEED